MFSAGLVALVASIGFAVATLLPREYVPLAIAYVRRFPTWSEILKPPEQVRAQTMQALVEAIAKERALNDRKARHVQRAFFFLTIGLSMLTAQAATLAWTEAL